MLMSSARQSPAHPSLRQRRQRPAPQRRCAASAALHAGSHVGSLLVAQQLRAFDDGIGNLRCKQPDRAQRVIVAGDHVIHFAGIAIRIHDGDHRNAQLAGFAHRNLLFVRIDHEDRVGQAGSCS